MALVGSYMGALPEVFEQVPPIPCANIVPDHLGQAIVLRRTEGKAGVE